MGWPPAATYLERKRSHGGTDPPRHHKGHIGVARDPARDGCEPQQTNNCGPGCPKRQTRSSSGADGGNAVAAPTTAGCGVVLLLSPGCSIAGRHPVSVL